MPKIDIKPVKATPEQMAKALFKLPPKHDWKYDKKKKR